MHHAHAAPAAAEGRLDDERKTDFLGDLQRLGAVRHRFFRAGQGGHVDFLRQRARRHFVAHQFNNLRARPDEGDARRRAGAGEFGVLRQKTVTGMDEIDFLFLGQRDDARDVQISADRPFAFADQDRLRPP